MSIAETAGGIKDKVVTCLRDLKRGYSDEDLRREIRISHGDILPDDRLRFRLGETDRVFNLINGVSLYPSPLRDTVLIPGYSLGIHTFLEQLNRLNELPDANIDQLLTQQAKAKLEAWHYHQRAPRIVNPSPHFPNSSLK